MNSSLPPFLSDRLSNLLERATLDQNFKSTSFLNSVEEWAADLRNYCITEHETNANPLENLQDLYYQYEFSILDHVLKTLKTISHDETACQLLHWFSTLISTVSQTEAEEKDSISLLTLSEYCHYNEASFHDWLAIVLEKTKGVNLVWLSEQRWELYCQDYHLSPHIDDLLKQYKSQLLIKYQHENIPFESYSEEINRIGNFFNASEWFLSDRIKPWMISGKTPHFLNYDHWQWSTQLDHNLTSESIDSKIPPECHHYPLTLHATIKGSATDDIDDFLFVYPQELEYFETFWKIQDDIDFQKLKQDYFSMLSHLQQDPTMPISTPNRWQIGIILQRHEPFQGLSASDLNTAFVDESNVQILTNNLLFYSFDYRVALLSLELFEKNKMSSGASAFIASYVHHLVQSPYFQEHLKTSSNPDQLRQWTQRWDHYYQSLIEKHDFSSELQTLRDKIHSQNFIELSQDADLNQFRSDRSTRI